jgi:hypothetical protein
MAYKLTKLQAVNIVLSNVGLSPVTSLDSQNPMVRTAEGIVDEVTNQVQSEGWIFNTEQDYPFNPDNNGDILIPDNVLRIDQVPWAATSLIVRGGKLYDKLSHSYTFDETIYADVVWYFDFIDLPEVFKQYIAIRAANLFAGRAVGSVEAVKYSTTEEGNARAACLEYETQQGDYNIFNDVSGQTEFLTYLPHKAIRRIRGVR